MAGTATIASGGGELEHMVREAGAAHGGTGLHVYHASYVNLVLGARSERGTVTLVAGSHTRSFPYFETEPWDNCLLQIGDAGYTFTGRVTGAALRCASSSISTRPSRAARSGSPARCAARATALRSRSSSTSRSR